MRKWLLFCLACIILQAQAVEIKGVRLPDTQTVAQTTLVLNGAGVRSKFLIEIYLIGLYTPQKMQDPQQIITLDKPRRVIITMLRKVDGESLQNSLMQGLQNNSTQAEMNAFRPQIAELDNLFKGISFLQKGERIIMDMEPGSGLKVNVRDQYKLDIASDAFASQMLKVWLGEAPVDKQLKAVLLGSPKK